MNSVTCPIRTTSSKTYNNYYTKLTLSKYCKMQIRHFKNKQLIILSKLNKKKNKEEKQKQL